MVGTVRILSPRRGLLPRPRVRLPLGDSLKASWDYLVLTVQAYANLFNPATTAQVLDQSTSVVGIAVPSVSRANHRSFRYKWPDKDWQSPLIAR